ncbi:chorismate mutase [Candidatus Woesearchaeota archaeon]|nr:chorismate mutase [Candidatus Woesearchaeota archaeon]
MLQKFRDDIRKIDEQLILLLAQRMEVARELGKYKKANNIPVFDADVEAAIIERNRRLAHNNGLGETFVQRLYEVILEESKKTQQK